MSLWFYLNDEDSSDPVFEKNITNNLSAMARYIGIYDILWEGSGKAKDMIGELQSGIRFMKMFPDQCKYHDNKNGWGSYEDFLPWLEELLVACKEYPDSIVEVSA